MGNNKFRLSDMIPNAWFYKLKDMGMRGKIHNSNTHCIRKKQPKTSPSSAAPPSPNPKHHHHNYHYPRKSYYFTRDLIPTCDQTFHTNSPLSTKSPHTHSPDPPPRKSSKQRVAVKRRTTTTTTSSRSSPKMVTTTSSVSAGCSCRASLWTNSDSPPPDFSVSPSDTSSQELFCSDSFPPEFRSDRILATTNDVLVINVDDKSLQNTNQLENPNMFDEMSDLHLPPIITKPPSKFSSNGLEKEEEDIKKKKDVINNATTKNIRRRRISAKNEETEDAAAANGSFSEKQSIIITTIKEQSKNNTTSSVTRNNYINSVTSPGGIRLRVNSPRIVSRRKSSGSSSISSNCSSSSLSRSNNNRGGGRRSLPDSLAIVKSSFDPRKDFRESMVEMIVENNIKGSKDLEDLLACYLSLNDDEYHDLIIMVFKQLWFDLTHITRPNNNN